MIEELGKLKPVAPGDSLFEVCSAERINAIQSLLGRLWAGENINSGGNVFVMPSGNGPTINVLAGGGGNGSSALSGENGPFGVKVTKQAPGYLLEVRPGTFGGLLPSNYNLTYTTATEAESVFLIATATATNGVVSSVTLSFSPTIADPIGTSLSIPPSPFSVTLGVLLAGKWYRLTAGSVSAVPAETFRVAKETFALGEIPYDAYYTWNIGTV